jgi:hypothetical protein
MNERQAACELSSAASEVSTCIFKLSFVLRTKRSDNETIDKWSAELKNAQDRLDKANEIYIEQLKKYLSAT